MNILTLIFGDRYAEQYGRALLQYFESPDFPKELLQYRQLNVLYRQFIYDKARRAGAEDGQELVDYLDALLEERRRELEDDKSDS